MRILVIGKFHVEEFGRHVAETLESMGHLVSRYDPGARKGDETGRIGYLWGRAKRAMFSIIENVPSSRMWIRCDLWGLAESESPELTIACGDFLWPAEVRRIREITKAPIVIWYPDSIAGFGRGHFMIASYDAIFLKDPFQVMRLRDVLSDPVHYLPECFNPDRHRFDGDITIAEKSKYSCEIATAGNLHAYRIAFFRHFQNFDVKIWGNPPPLWARDEYLKRVFQGEYVVNEEKAKAFRMAKIVVNNLLYSEIWGVNARAFEVAGSGGFQCIDWRPGLSQLFEDGVELVSFRGVGDLREKIAYFLPRDDERQKIASAGMARALRQHTYRDRLNTMLSTVAGSERGFPMPCIHE